MPSLDLTQDWTTFYRNRAIFSELPFPPKVLIRSEFSGISLRTETRRCRCKLKRNLSTFFCFFELADQNLN